MLGTNFGRNLEKKNNFIKNCIDFCAYCIHFFRNIFIVSLNYIPLAYLSRIKIPKIKELSSKN